jgi:hypothetical protein
MDRDRAELALRLVVAADASPLAVLLAVEEVVAGRALARLDGRRLRVQRRCGVGVAACAARRVGRLERIGLDVVAVGAHHRLRAAEVRGVERRVGDVAGDRALAGDRGGAFLGRCRLRERRRRRTAGQQHADADHGAQRTESDNDPHDAATWHSPSLQLFGRLPFKGRSIDRAQIRRVDARICAASSVARQEQRQTCAEAISATAGARTTGTRAPRRHRRR